MFRIQVLFPQMTFTTFIVVWFIYVYIFIHLMMRQYMLKEHVKNSWGNPRASCTEAWGRLEEFNLISPFYNVILKNDVHEGRMLCRNQRSKNGQCSRGAEVSRDCARCVTLGWCQLPATVLVAFFPGLWYSREQHFFSTCCLHGSCCADNTGAISLCKI